MAGKPVTVAHHNRVIRAGVRRVLKLEPKLVKALTPVFEQAGRDAAKAFTAKATVVLTAAAYLDANQDWLLTLPPAEALALVAAAGAERTLQDALGVVDSARRQLANAVHVGDAAEIANAQVALQDAEDRLQRALTGGSARKAKKKDQPPLTPTAAPTDIGDTQAPNDITRQATRQPGGGKGISLAEEVATKGAEEQRIEDQISGEIERITQTRPGDLATKLKDVLTSPFGGKPDWVGPLADEIVNVAYLVDQLRGKTDPVRQAVAETLMRTSVEGAGVAFDLTNPFAAKVLAQSGSQITEIAQTTQLNVMRIIAASHEQGLSIPDTAKAIRAGMAEATPARATLIARTELVGAVNGGSLAATQIVQSATDETYYKQWLTAPGAPNPRHEDYEGLDEQTVALDEYFDVGGAQLQYPGDPDGPPEEVCNCRCTLVYVSAQDAADQGIELGGTSTEPATITPEDAAAQHPLFKPVQEPTTITTDSPETAAQALWDGQQVALQQPEQIATLIDDLGKMAKQAQEDGIAAPPLNLGDVSVPGTNLFTQDSIGVPRVEMPQLKGVPAPGSLADAMPRDVRGEVDIAPLFYKQLQDEGVPIDYNQSVRVDHLRATQTELDGTKVAGIMDYLEGGGKIEGSIPVTKDGYVIDGHHRWAAEVGLDYKSNADKPWMIQADVVNKDITSVITEANLFATEYGLPQSSAFVKSLAKAKEGTTIGITPFRPTDTALNFYDSAKAKQFEADIKPTAEEFGVTVSQNERVSGVWQGESEPSYSLIAHDGPDGVAQFAAVMRARYDQDGVLLFKPNPVGENYSYTLHRVDPEKVIPKLSEYGIDGATAAGDSVTIIGDLAQSDNVSRLAKEFKSVVTAQRGELGFVERGDVPRSIPEISALHPGVELYATNRDYGIVVSKISVPAEVQGKGAASQAMDDLLRYADAHGLAVGLTPEAIGGGMSTTQLKAWYKRLGFVPNKGSAADPRFSESMIRRPLVGEGGRALWDPYGISIEGAIEDNKDAIKRARGEAKRLGISLDNSVVKGELARLEEQRKNLNGLRQHPDPKAELSLARQEQLGLQVKVDDGTATAAERARFDKLDQQIEMLAHLRNSPEYASLETARQVAADLVKQQEIAARQEAALREAVVKGEQLKADQIQSTFALKAALTDKQDDEWVRIPARTVRWSDNGNYDSLPGAAWRHGDVTFTAEVGSPSADVGATVTGYQKKVEPWVDGLPPEIRGRLDQVNIYNGASPDEVKMRIEYGGDGYILASTGQGQMNFWHALDQPDALTRGTAEHESGHLMFLGGGAKSTEDWINAANKDSTLNRRRYGLTQDMDPFVGKTPGSFRGFLVGARGVSDYGGSALEEDWAESIRLYLLDRREGSIGTLTGDSVRFAQIYPERAKLIEKWLPGLKSEPAPTVPGESVG